MSRENEQVTKPVERAWANSELGLVVLDPSLKPMAFNWDAALILSYPERPSRNQKLDLRIPDEILQDIRQIGSTGPIRVMTRFNAGRRRYICHANVLDSYDGDSVRPAIALLLQRRSSAPEAIHEVAAHFNLTGREREALEGIAMGLRSKELATRMGISPNTVKAYLHLIMVKMGVTTRAGIVAKVLEHNPANGRNGLAVAIPRAAEAAK